MRLDVGVLFPIIPSLALLTRLKQVSTAAARETIPIRDTFHPPLRAETGTGEQSYMNVDVGAYLPLFRRITRFY